jgi:fibronectin-binding autotransporter adhesin
MKNRTSTLPSLSAVFAAPTFPRRHSRSRAPLCLVASVAALLLCHALSTQAETWNLAAGGTWNATGSWNPASIPNAVGANATFNNAASGSNPAQTGSRTVTADGAKTVGSINFNNDAANTFTMSITTGTAGSLTFDEVGAGPATITVPAVVGTGNNTISAAMTLTDDLVATVDNITASSAAGALNLTATITGPGGFTKQGDGTATFGTGAKTYTGPTVLSGGRMRMSFAARAQSTSSLTINTGGQLTLISAGTYDFGPLTLNGAGPTAGPSAPFPGAIRNDTGLVVTINNAVVLQSDTVLHVQGSAAGSMTMAGNMSGPGKLTYTSTPHDANLGVLVLNGANTYSGGTVVDGGTLRLSGAGATLGTGDVTVHSASAAFPGATAKLSIEAGVLDAISDTAILSLAGGGTAGVADDGIADLGAGVNESVGYLVLGGVTQVPGTYGSTASTATYQNDEYFTGTGIITALLSRPLLTISLSAPDVVLSWPTNAVGFGLQGVGTLGGIWTDDTTPKVVADTNYTVTELAPTNKFFRLKK